LILGSAIGTKKTLLGGQSASAPPLDSDVNLLGNSERVIHLDSQVFDSALDLCVPEQELHRTKVSGAPVNQCRLSAAYEWVPNNEGSKAKATDPVGYQSRVLPRGETLLLRSAWELALAKSPRVSRKIIINRLTRLLGELEAHGSAGLLLANSCTLDRISVWSDILQSQAHEIAAPQLTVGCQIEESQVSRSLRELQSPQPIQYFCKFILPALVGLPRDAVGFWPPEIMSPAVPLIEIRDFSGLSRSCVMDVPH